MEKKKYWRNVRKGPFFRNLEPGMSGTSIWAHNNEYRSGTTLGYHCLTSTYQSLSPHSHPFLELLCFLGGNPEDVNNLGARVSICLGEEMEEYVTDTAVVIYIPAGLMHCPLRVINVTRPLVFLEVSETPGYTSTMDEDIAAMLLNPPEKQEYDE